ncbi:MAG: site-specific integrase, partial [Sneathiellales bacterium]|nr:site-specific integrase [Sneathiellales bacterium]
VDNCDFSELDADEVLQVYQRIYTATEEVGRRENYVASLRWLHRYGMVEHDWPMNKALADFLKTTADLTYVSTSIVDHRHVYNVLEAIDRSNEDEIFKTQLKLILLIGYRCGLRIGEILKLRFRDIDPASDWAISVRGSRLGSNKSDNSLRRIEFANVASNDELELFKQYFHEIGVDSKVSDYLFGLGGQDIPLNKVRCSQLLGGALRQSTGNNEVVFHSLRHSWASSSYAIIDQEWELAGEMTGFDPEKLISVRRYWLRSDDFMRDGLRQLSKAIGHADPSTTCQTYLHLQPESVHRKIANVIWPKRSVQESIKKLRNFRQSELDTMGYDLVMNRLAKQVRKHTGEDVIPVRKDVSFKPNLTFDLPATYFIMMSALKKVEDGQDLGHVSAQYPVAEQELQGMIDRCRALVSLKTRVKTSKLVKQRAAKDNGDVRPVLLPSLHPSPEIRELVIDISNAIRKGCQKKTPRKIIIKQAVVVLKALTTGGHYLRVDKHEDLSAIVSFTQDVLSEEQWFFDLVVHVQDHVENEHVKAGNAAAYWRQDPVFKTRGYRPRATPGDGESDNERGVVHV